MTAGSFRTELPTMQQASSHVAQVNEQIQGQLRSLWARLEPIAGSWQGAASSDFQVLHERWQADATKLNSALLRISEALQTNERTYSETEQTNSTGFSKIASGLS